MGPAHRPDQILHGDINDLAVLKADLIQRGVAQITDVINDPNGLVGPGLIRGSFAEVYFLRAQRDPNFAAYTDRLAMIDIDFANGRIDPHMIGAVLGHAAFDNVC